MHSRIFQISKEPILEDDYISVEDYETYDDSFIGSVADYVAETRDRGSDIRWLAARDLITLGRSEDGYDTIVFNEGYKENHFKERLEKLKKNVKEISLKSFSNSVMNAYALEVLIEDKYGFYFETDDNERLSFDSFVREYVREGQVYYIGGTLDFHC